MLKEGQPLLGTKDDGGMQVFSGQHHLVTAPGGESVSGHGARIEWGRAGGSHGTGSQQLRQRGWGWQECV